MDAENAANQIRHYWLYVIALEDSCYYVGITSSKDPQSRIDQHKSDPSNLFSGSKWTGLHPYISTVEIRSLGKMDFTHACIIENRVTREYIEKFGLDYVRGGDIVYKGKYFDRFGRYFMDTDWYGLKVTAIMLITILILIMGYMYEKYLV